MFSKLNINGVGIKMENKKEDMKINKKTSGLILISSVLLILLVIIASPQASSAGTKANQYYNGNLTCENFTDNILWSGLSTKAKVNNFLERYL